MTLARRFTALLFLAAFPGSVQAWSPVEVLSADRGGVTLRLAVPDYRVEPAADGRGTVVVPGFQVMDVPGRPGIPFVTVLIAVPPGARAEARPVPQDVEEEQVSTRLAVAGRPLFRQDESRRGIPGRESVAPLADGPWPAAAVEVGEPFTWRRQRLVAVSLRPFRYEEERGRLLARRSLAARIDFVGAAPPGGDGPAREDRHWEPVLREAVLNYEQGRSWREPARPARRAAALGIDWREGERAARPPGGDRVSGLAGAAAFEEDFPEVRVRIDTTGVYELPYEDLFQAGYPSGVDTARVSVHRHEFVENSIPPYVTIELPIEVDDANQDGVFNEGDRVIVFVQSWAERARASQAQRVWGDAEVIYVTQVAGQGRRIATRPGWRGVPGLTPLPSYPWTQRWEKNLYYLPFPVDTLADQFLWTEVAPYYERPDSLAFATNHIDGSLPATLSLTLVGRREVHHVDWAQVRNGAGAYLSVMDSVHWFGRGVLTRTATLPAGFLGEGNVNRVRVWGKSGLGPPDPITNAVDRVGVDHFEVTYWRRYRALVGYLAANSGTVEGEFQIRASGFATPSVRVYDVTDSLNPVRLTLDAFQVRPSGPEFTVEFQDLAAAGRPGRYIAFVAGRSVPPGAITRVTRRQLASRGSGDYLMVVPEALLPAVGPLVSLRQAQGLDVVVAPLESVQDEFNGGRKSSYAVKRFIRHAFENWNARFVLLIGDGSEDPQNFSRESGLDWIPTQKISGPVGIQFGLEIVPADPWYACMNNCDVQSSSQPVLQDLFLGRLPVRTLQQARDVVAKLVAYESFGVDQPWRNALLLSADDEYSGATFFGGDGSSGPTYCRRFGEAVFKQLNETIASVVADQAGLRRTVLDRFYLQDLLSPDVACLDPNCVCRDLPGVQNLTRGSVTPQLISRLNAGRLWWNYQGHANEQVLSHEDLYLNRGSLDDKDQLTNHGKPFLFTAFSCHANAFARFREDAPGNGPALGEEMVTLARRGAIASWASSGYEILPFSGSSHINVALARALFERPPRDEYLGDKGARVVLGEAIALALAKYVPGVLFNPSEKGIALTYQLLGDPGTRISIGPVQALVIANGDTVTSGVPVALSPPRDTLHLQADLASTVEIRSIVLTETSGSGTRVIPDSSYTITPAFPDTGAGGLGGRRYRLSYSTPLRPGVYLYTIRTVDRYGLTSDFEVKLQFQTVLKLSGNPLAEKDVIVPTADLSLKVILPIPISDPATQLRVRVDSLVSFVADPLDPFGREWLLRWTHAPYPPGTHTLEFAALDSLTTAHRFQVVDPAAAGSRLLWNVLAFPNPFDDQVGTTFSFYFLSERPADVALRVFTVAGRLLYQRTERGLLPGAQEWIWDGRDAEGNRLANGVYLYRVVAAADGRADTYDGRLVKLRRPRRVYETP